MADFGQVPEAGHVGQRRGVLKRGGLGIDTAEGPHRLVEIGPAGHGLGHVAHVEREDRAVDGRTVDAAGLGPPAGDRGETREDHALALGGAKDGRLRSRAGNAQRDRLTVNALAQGDRVAGLGGLDRLADGRVRGLRRAVAPRGGLRINPEFAGAGRDGTQDRGGADRQNRHATYVSPYLVAHSAYAPW
jgi:hypothetical protein